MQPHPTEPRKRWGQNVVAARTGLGLPAAELARRVDITAKHMSEIENGRSLPSYELQELLAGVLGQELTSLFPRNEAEADLAVRCSGGH